MKKELSTELICLGSLLIFSVITSLALNTPISWQKGDVYVLAGVWSVFSFLFLFLGLLTYLFRVFFGKSVGITTRIVLTCFLGISVCAITLLFNSLNLYFQAGDLGSNTDGWTMDQAPSDLNQIVPELNQQEFGAFTSLSAGFILAIQCSLLIVLIWNNMKMGSFYPANKKK